MSATTASARRRRWRSGHPAADIFVTVDSNTLLDEQAIENGLQPFAKPKVMSVAGMLIGLNRRHSLLTRLVDLAGHTDSTLNTRACHSWRRRRHQHAEAKGAAELVGGVDPVT